MPRKRSLAPWLVLASMLAGCSVEASPAREASAVSPPESAAANQATPASEATATSQDACWNADGALNDAAFVIAREPMPGARVRSGFAVAGCSRTFESNVRWRLLARDGSELASGFTTGGGVDGPAAFRFTVEYSVAASQIGHLEVFEEDASDGEGFPPGRTVIPLVLQP